MQVQQQKAYEEFSKLQKTQKEQMKKIMKERGQGSEQSKIGSNQQLASAKLG